MTADPARLATARTALAAVHAMHDAALDAVTEDDDWTAPVFEESQRRWPSLASTQGAV